MITIRPVQTLLVLSLLSAMALGCASTAPLLVVKGETSEPVFTGLHYRVERNDFSKKVRFHDLDAPRTVVMKYSEAQTTWGSPLNLLFDEDVYEKESHRMRVRFRNPLTGQPMALVANARSHRVATVEVRTTDALPVIELYAEGEEQPRGTVRYDDHGQILFSGEIEKRRIEIERMSDPIPPALNRGLLKHVMFSFPDAGEFVVRIDGREAAWFGQFLQNGPVSPYDLSLNGEEDLATREDAMLAFVVFDLMKDFVNETY